jgi:hypothetical protein
MRPPIRLDVSQRTFLGFTVRHIVIAVATGAAALLMFTGLATLPLFLRAMLAVLIAGLGLAWAFGEIDGQTPEAWLMEVLLFRHRSRYLVHRMAREDGGPRRVVFPNPQSTPHLKEVVDEPAATPAAPGFFWLSANAIGLALLTGLSLWLLQGGAEQLSAMWRGL